MARAPKLDAVVDAALTLFARNGVAATAMPDLAKEAGIGVGTIYRHFATKEELANHIYRMCKRKLITALWRDDGAESVEAAFLSLWRRMVAFAIAEPKAFRFLELHHHADYIDADSRRLDEEALAPAVPFLAAGAAAGAMRPVPPQIAISLVWGGVVMLVKDAGFGRLTLDEQTIEAAGACLWRALAAAQHPG